MKKNLKKLTALLTPRSSIAFAYLFGSRVNGYADEKSDWDGAVYFYKLGEETGQWPAFELEAELSSALEATVQVFVLNESIPPVLGFEIVKWGVILLDRDENLRMDFENKVLSNYYDWQYFLNRQMKAERRLSLR